MAKVGIVAVIDVGSTKICTLLANVSDGEITRVLGLGIEDSLAGGVPTGVQRGIILDTEATKRAIKNSVEKAERTSDFKIRSVYIGISGKHITSFTNPGIKQVSGRVRREDRERAYRNSIPSLPEDRRVLDALPIAYVIDGQVVENPVGMYGFRLDVISHIITAGQAQTANLEACVRGTGLGIEGIIANPLASGLAVLQPEDMEERVIVADIGGETTDITVFKKGLPWYVSVLPVGGEQITKDIGVGLKLPFKAAEGLKVKYGEWVSDTELDSITDSISLKEFDMPGEVLRQDLLYIIKARVEEIMRLLLVKLEDDCPEFKKWEPTRVVLTGGTAKLPGIEDLAQGVFGFPARKGIPRYASQFGLSEIDSLAYSAGIGLLLLVGAEERKEGVEVPSIFSRILARLRSIKLPALPIELRRRAPPS